MFIDQTEAVSVVDLIDDVLRGVLVNVANHNHVCFLVFDSSSKCFWRRIIRSISSPISIFILFSYLGS